MPWLASNCGKICSRMICDGSGFQRCEDALVNACQGPKIHGKTNPRASNEIDERNTIRRPRGSGDFLYALPRVFTFASSSLAALCRVPAQTSLPSIKARLASSSTESRTQFSITPRTFDRASSMVRCAGSFLGGFGWAAATLGWFASRLCPHRRHHLRQWR